MVICKFRVGLILYHKTSLRFWHLVCLITHLDSVSYRRETKERRSAFWKFIFERIIAGTANACVSQSQASFWGGFLVGTSQRSNHKWELSSSTVNSHKDKPCLICILEALKAPLHLSFIHLLKSEARIERKLPLWTFSVLLHMRT